MASISRPFVLDSLPKIGSLSDFSLQADFLHVSDDFVLGQNTVTVGVSSSSISQYVVNPTPKVVSSLPIPTTNSVTAANVGTIDKAGDEVWCYALKANKSSNLCLARKIGSATEFAQNYTVKVSDKIVSIRVDPQAMYAVVVLANGHVQFYDFELKLLHSADISYENVMMVEHFQQDEKWYIILLCSLENDKVCYKLFELSDSQERSSNQYIRELISVVLENFPLADCQCCYEPGKLYRLTSAGELFIYSLPHCRLQRTVKIPFLADTKSGVSFKSVSSNRLLLTAGNKIYLIDILHNAILFDRELTHAKTFRLLKSVIIEKPETKTIAIGVATKVTGKTSSSSLEIINVDVGTGTLKDSLGKSFENMSLTSNKSNPLKPLFEGNEALKQVNFDYEKIYNNLAENKSDILQFDNIFFTSLNIKKAHYTENDRFVNDTSFLTKVLDLILRTFSTEFPKAFTYLLTHPLYPREHTMGLLAKLREGQPRLYRQAIVTCPNLPLADLLFELFTIKNTELSLDISLRILQDYSKDSIRAELHNLSKIDIDNFIEFMISNSKEQSQTSPQLFELLSLVLDSSGLFALEGTLLNNLAEYIDQQVKIAERNNKLWYMLEDKGSKQVATASSNALVAKKEKPSAYSVEYLDI